MAINTFFSTETSKLEILSANLQHVAIIMDGNRRWAKSKSLPSMFGHAEGIKAMKSTVNAAQDIGLKYLTVYAFSTENWGREHEEVEFLMKLLKDTVLNEMREMHEKNMKIRIIGDLAPLKPELKKLLKETEELTFNNTGLNFQIAINYGSRNEIAQAVKNIARDFKAGIIKSEDEISEDLISKYLYTYEIPDPDLLIRTGGEQRVSNYLLWQIAYSELYVTNVFWPDFNKEELQKAFMAFSERKRRFGRD